MKKYSKYITSVVFLCLALCACICSVYSLKYAKTSTSGKISFISNGCSLEVSAVISNATNLTTPTLESTTLYVNKTNTDGGDPILIKTNLNSDLDLGEFYFVDNEPIVADIEIAITLTNKNIFPVKLSISFADSNNVGAIGASSKAIYLANNSYDMSENLYLYEMGQPDSTKTIYFYLHLKDIHRDLSNISFNLQSEIKEVVTPSTYTESSAISLTIKDYQGTTIANGGEVTTVHSTIDTFLTSTLITDGTYTLKYDFANSDSTRKDVSKPVTLGYSLNSEDVVILKYLLLSKDSDFSTYTRYNLSGTQESIDLVNLYNNTTYYYKFCLTLLDGSGIYKSGTFKTKLAPRIITVDGVNNFRDIGGWQTGVNIKQGLLYRGTEIDGRKETSYEATTAGKNTLLNDLDIKYDMDLRSVIDSSNDPDQKSVLGVNGKVYDYTFYSSALTSSKTKDVFKDLAKPENYPMYLHCTYGTDRTGTACALLEALLGVSIEEIYKDYILTALWSDFTAKEENMPAMLKALSTYPGTSNNLSSDATLQQRAEQVLLDLGVTASEIASIKNIFLG